MFFKRSRKASYVSLKDHTKRSTNETTLALRLVFLRMRENDVTSKIRA